MMSKQYREDQYRPVKGQAPRDYSAPRVGLQKPKEDRGKQGNG